MFREQTFSCRKSLRNEVEPVLRQAICRGLQGFRLNAAVLESLGGNSCHATPCCRS